MASFDEIIENIEESMMSAIEALEHDFSGFRTGKANPALVENIMVEYYGSSSRLRDIAGISTPEPRLIAIQAWDKSILPEIEKAIQGSGIGINPINDGGILRLPIPELSEERRRDLIKQMKRRAEDAKVEIRNHRRTANEEAKKAEKSSEINKDSLSELLKEIQKLTDDYIKQIDDLTAKKEKELLTV